MKNLLKFLLLSLSIISSVAFALPTACPTNGSTYIQQNFRLGDSDSAGVNNNGDDYWQVLFPSDAQEGQAAMLYVSGIYSLKKNDMDGHIAKTIASKLVIQPLTSCNTMPVISYGSAFCSYKPVGGECSSTPPTNYSKKSVVIQFNK